MARPKKNSGVQACVIGKMGDDAKKISEEEYNDIIDSIEFRRGQGHSGPGIIKPALDKIKKQQALVKRAALLNAIARKKMVTQVGRFAEGKDSAAVADITRVAEEGNVTDSFIKSAGKITWEGIYAFFAGSNQRSALSRYSMDSGASKWTQIIQGSFDRAIKNSKAAKVFEGDSFLFFKYGTDKKDKLIAKEVEQLTTKDGKPGITGDAEAAELAAIIVKHNRLAIKMQNLYGAYIEDLPGFVAMQFHNPTLLAKMGKDAWVGYLLENGENGKRRLDVERTFFDSTGRGPKTDAEVAAALGKVFDSLVNGNFANDLPVGEMVAGMGKASEAKRISEQHRVLHFNGAENFVEYNAKLGHGTLFNAALATYAKASRNINVLERMGPNPLANFEFLVRLAKDQDSGPNLRGNERKARALYASAMGDMDLIVNHRFAQWSSNYRVLQRISGLGMMVVSSVTDYPVQAARMTFNGRGFFESLASQLNYAIFSRPDAKEIAERVLVGFESYQRDVTAAWDGAMEASGKIGRVQEHFFKMATATFWEQTRERSAIADSSVYLAQQSSKSFDALNKKLRSELVRNGIGSNEWELLRKHGKTKTSTGAEFLDPADVTKNITNEEVLAYMGRKSASESAILRAKIELNGKLRNYYVDTLNQTLLRPGVREKAYQKFYMIDANRGTLAGEGLAHLWLFKSYPTQFFQRVIGQFTQEDDMHRIAGAALRGKGLNKDFAKLIASLTVMGAISLYLSSFLKNETPPDIRDPKTWGMIAAKSGGLGIYGDFLLSASNRYGNSFIATATGPTASDIESAIRIGAGLADGPYQAITDNDWRALTRVGDETFKLFKANTPYANLFYLRASMDVLIWQNIHEIISPGANRRRLKALKERTGQTQMIGPIME
jgi:hypothetical protein